MPKEQIKQVFRSVMESKGKKPVSVAMRESGYAVSTSTNPQVVTRSKTWEKLAKEFIPDRLLARKHRALLDKQEVLIRNNNQTGKVEVIKTGQIDANAVAKGLDMAYKIKRMYPEQNRNTIVPIQVNFDKLRNDYGEAL